MRSAAWLGGLVVTIALALTSRARAQQTEPLPRAEAEAQKRERATLLAPVLREAVRRRSAPAWAPVLVAAGGFEMVAGIAADEPLFVAGGAIAASGGAAFFWMPESRNYELLGAAAAASTGFVYLGLPWDDPFQRVSRPLGAAYLSMAALGAINTIYSRHPGRSQLLIDWQRVRTPAGRHGLTSSELHRIERDLYATDPFVPSGLMGLPLVIGGLLAGMPLFDGDVVGRDKLLIGTLSGLSLLQGLAFTFAATPTDLYRDALGESGLWVSWSPTVGGLSVLGGFD